MLKYKMKLNLNSLKKQFNSMCNPAKFYLVLTLVGVIAYIPTVFLRKHRSPVQFSVHVVLAIVWAVFLNWVCTLTKSNKLSWFLLLLPLLFLVIFLVLFLVGGIAFVTLGGGNKKDGAEKDSEECTDCGNKLY